MGYHPEFMQRNWLTMVRAKEAEAIKQAPTPDQPAAASATAPATQSSDAQSTATQSLVTQSQKYCAICTPIGNLCPNEYFITAVWQDNSKKEDESQEQNKDKDNFSVVSDWDADLEEHDRKNLEVQEQKNNDNKTPKQPQTYIS